MYIRTSLLFHSKRIQYSTKELVQRGGVQQDKTIQVKNRLIVLSRNFPHSVPMDS